VAFSPDGAILASGALDGAINLWQVSDGKLLKTLKGHTDNVMGVAFTKDGRLASVSSDGTDPPVGREISALWRRVCSSCSR
jgi:WD40 repeat protein